MTIELLSRPLCSDDLDKANVNFEEALKRYARLSMAEEPGKCRYASAGLLIYLEFVLYTLNKRYIEHGIKNIPAEIFTFKLLPVDFVKHYLALVNADNIVVLKENALALIKNTNDLLERVREEVAEKKTATSDDMCGSYEEIYSNWKNKMHTAAKDGDKYLSLMMNASCQCFYDETFSWLNIPHFDLFSGFDINDLEKSARNFDGVMEEYVNLYKQTSTNICRYEKIEDFVKDYLSD